MVFFCFVAQANLKLTTPRLNFFHAVIAGVCHLVTTLIKVFKGIFVDICFKIQTLAMSLVTYLNILIFCA